MVGYSTKNGSHIFSDMMVKEIVHPKFVENLQAIQNGEFWRNVALHRLLKNRSSAVVLTAPIRSNTLVLGPILTINLLLICMQMFNILAVY